MFSIKLIPAYACILCALIPNSVAGTTEDVRVSTTEPRPFTIPPPRPSIPPIGGSNLCGNGKDSEYAECLQTTRANQTDLCQPLQEKQGLPYFRCLCESYVSILKCYDICPVQGFAYQMEEAQSITYCSAADLSRPRTPSRSSSASRTFDNTANDDERANQKNNLAKPTNRGALAPVANSDEAAGFGGVALSAIFAAAAAVFG